MRLSSLRPLAAGATIAPLIVVSTLVVASSGARAGVVVHPGGPTLVTLPPITVGPTPPVPLTASGNLFGWGYSKWGALGDGTTNLLDHPEPNAYLRGVTSVQGADYGGLASEVDGSAWSWGNDQSGELGNGTFGTGRLVPREVPGVTHAVSVAAGIDSRFVVTSGGRVYAWGDNHYGQLCMGGALTSPTAALVPGLTGVRAVASSGFFTYVLKTNGTVWGCGSGVDGTLGSSVAGDSSVPVLLPFPDKVTAVAASANVGYAVSDGQVWAIGNNEFGGLGNGLEVYGRDATPSLVDKLAGVKQLASTGLATLALLTSGRVDNWGEAVGTDIAAPVAVLTEATAVAVDSMQGGYYAVQAGHVWQWGNLVGALGTGHPDNQATPVEVPSPGGVIGLGSGYQTTFAIANAG